jgi:hypothetical protein
MYFLIKWAVTLELSVQYWCCFYTAPDATKSSVNNTISKTQYQSFAADVFLIYLLEKRNKMAVTAYSVLRLRFWTKLLRNVAIMNIGSVDPNFTGSRSIAEWKRRNEKTHKDTDFLSR